MEDILRPVTGRVMEFHVRCDECAVWNPAIVDFRLKVGRIYEKAISERLIVADEISQTAARLWDIEPSEKAGIRGMFSVATWGADRCLHRVGPTFWVKIAPPPKNRSGDNRE